jgi:hypothetical protein
MPSTSVGLTSSDPPQPAAMVANANPNNAAHFGIVDEIMKPPRVSISLWLALF